MLIACESCHRQYDVGAHAAGTQLACACGCINTVPAADDPRYGHGGDARMVHCSSCGAGLPADASDCGYCGSGVGVAERGFGDVCPQCLHRMLAGARFCGSCGSAVRPEVAPQALTSWECPRCDGALHEHDATAGRIVECRECGGLWLDEHVFDRIVEQRDAQVRLPRRAPQSSRTPQGGRVKVQYLKCPVCSELMHRRNFAKTSGVILDWCRGHGWWFDADELDRVLTFVANGGLDQARERRLADLRREEARQQMRASRTRQPSFPTASRHATPLAAGTDVIGAITAFLSRLL